MKKIYRKELRAIVESQIRLNEQASDNENTLKTPKAAAPPSVPAWVAASSPTAFLINYLWQSGKLDDKEAVAAGIMKMKYPGAYQLWKNLDPDVKQALIDLASAASNLPTVLNKQLKDMAIETLEAATGAITP